ncbi:MAG TPA: sugar phosphate isomerase/epimerase family protein [Bryobacterales bacterium]|nr:sugar phosphate isomerase/epimerase family protein [Bryobacterales bacterium]
MAPKPNRRTFLGASIGASATGLLAAAAPAGAERLPIHKAVLLSMLPKQLSYAERFQLARDCGFEQIELPTTPDPRDAEELKQASEKTGLRIHSVMNMAHWKYPLSSADPAVVAESVKGMETSLQNAHLWGADTVLLVPAVVNPETSYKDAWVRSQQQIRKLIPLAEELKVIIAVEEVWNKFLLSPLEFAHYVDEFKSPWVRAYFDVGNVVLYGYPQDWIRTLNKRIVKLHIKDFTFKDRIAKFVDLRDGDIAWPEIYRALREIGYSGSATVELRGGDEAYLKEVSRRFDLILTGA